MSCGECDIISLYCMCCSVNGSVCLVCCVFDSVCGLFGETIRNMFGVAVILLLNVLEVFSVGGVQQNAQLLQASLSYLVQQFVVLFHKRYHNVQVVFD